MAKSLAQIQICMENNCHIPDLVQAFPAGGFIHVAS